MPMTATEPLRVRRAFLEATRNSLSAGARGYLIFFSVALSLLGPATSDAVAVHATALEEERFILAGATVQLINAPGQVSRFACEALSESRAIIASGSLSLNRGVISRGTSSTLMHPVSSISPGLMAALGALSLLKITSDGTYDDPITSETIFTTDELAAQSGIAPGVSGYRLLGEPGGQERPVSVIGFINISDVLPAAAGSAISLHSTSSGFSDSCLVLGAPGNGEAVAALAVLAAPDAVPLTRVPQPLLYASDFTFDASIRVTTRETEYLWVAGGVLAALIWILPLGFRRSEIGLYASLGLRRLDIASIRGIEGMIMVAVGALAAVVSALAAGVTLAWTSASLWAITLPEIAASACLAAALALIVGGATAVFGDASAMVKDR